MIPVSNIPRTHHTRSRKWLWPLAVAGLFGSCTDRTAVDGAPAALGGESASAARVSAPSAASAARPTSTVPATVPDSIPDDLYGNYDNIMYDSPYFPLSNMVLKEIISVRFEDDASQAQRQAAVDAVGGKVVGGIPFPKMEGYYLIRVEDDGTGKQMSEAIEFLYALPHVGHAEPQYLFNPGDRLLWLKPKDDNGWGWRAVRGPSPVGRTRSTPTAAGGSRRNSMGKVSWRVAPSSSGAKKRRSLQAIGKYPSVRDVHPAATMIQRLRDHGQ